MKISLPQIDLAGVLDEFRNLDPNDPGNWPLVPKVTALVALFVAVVAAGWWFFWAPDLETLKQKEAEQESLKTEWLNKKRQAVNVEQYRAQLAEIDRAFGSLLKQLPNRSEMESLLVDISQAGLGRGLQFEIWKPQSESVKDFYAELPISLRVTGAYHDLGNFAGDVAKLSRIVNLGSISVEGTKEAGLLKMDAVATTYRYLDEDELAQAKRAKAEKEKGGKK